MNEYVNTPKLSNNNNQPIFVSGGGGYVGGRLIPRLLEDGYRVRALARSPEKLHSRRWGGHPLLEIVRGDVLDYPDLLKGVEGCRAAYYLIHSMNPAVDDFSHTDRVAAMNMTKAAAAVQLKQIIYLGGLGEQGSGLSHHLQSRSEVGASSKV